MSSVTNIESKPKKELNPIIKSMNEFRNNVIGPHIGSKAPVKTAPVFKMAITAARLKLGIDEDSKNTLEVVATATELFQDEPDKYVSMSEKFMEEKSKSKDSDSKKEKKQKKIKSNKTMKNKNDNEISKEV